MEYFFLQSRKKGFLQSEDSQKRLKNVRTYVKKPLKFWQYGIAFYLDGVGWSHKRNPSDHAVTLWTWGKGSEGTKMGVEGKMIYFIEAIA